jgi:hypothetical protein
VRAICAQSSGTAEIDGVPQNNGVDDEVQAGGAIGHGFSNAVAQFAELVKGNGARQGMTTFALIREACDLRRNLVSSRLSHEDRALNAAHFAQRLPLTIARPITTSMSGNIRKSHGSVS